MSLINDALKRVEKSLNDNSPDQKMKQPMSSYPTEPSGRDKKLFLIALIGGTLFFSILILLLVLIFSNSSTSSVPTTSITPPPSSSGQNALINQPEVEEKENTIIPEESIPPQKTDTLKENNVTESNIENEEENVPMDSAKSRSNEAPSSDTSTDENVLNNGEKRDLNEEFFEGMVNLASKAFTRTNSKLKTQAPTKENISEEPVEKPKENFTLSTAQATLEKIQNEERPQKKPQLYRAPKNQVQDYVDSLVVSGVMISNNDSMALINSRVYPKNSIIDSTHSLSLIDIQPQKIVLRDGSGNTYDVYF